MFFLVRAERENSVESLFRPLGIGLVLLTILTVWKFLSPPPEWTVPGGRIEWQSAIPGFISVRHLGSWTGAIAAGLMIALLYGKTERRRQTSLFYLLAAGLTCWSGTRAAILSMVVVALIVLASLRRWPNIRALLSVAGLSAMAMLGAVVFSPDLPEFSLFMRDNLQSANTLTTGRLGLWEATLARWLDAPWFGWGSGSTFWELGWLINQPHNAVVQFLVSWGIVGTAGAMWLLGRAIATTHRTGMAHDALRPLAGMVYSLLFMSLLEGMLFYPRFIMPIAIGFAVLLVARERDEQDRSHNQRTLSSLIRDIEPVTSPPSAR